MSGRDGFALVSVLWLVAMLGVLLSVGVAPALVATSASENRVHLTRARWAALGCLELVRARHASGRRELSSEPVSLGEKVSCVAERLDPDERINPNVGDSVGLARALGDPVRVASLLDWMDEDDLQREAGAEVGWYAARHRRPPRDGPFADVAELTLVRGFEGETAASLERLFTTGGDGSVSPNRAPVEALRSVSVFPLDAVERLMRMRASGRRFDTAEQVAAVLGLRLTTSEFRTLTTRLSFSEGRRTIRFTGSLDAGRRTLYASVTAALADAGERLAVLSLEVR